MAWTSAFGGCVLTDAPVLLHDLFPARWARSEGLTLRGARVLVSADHAWAYVDSGGQPTLGDEAEVARIVGSGGRLELVLPDGTTVTARREGGCGCGSVLRRWQPFTPMRMGT